MNDIIELLEAVAEKTPDKMFLAWEPFDQVVREWTYRAFLDDIQAVAGGFSKRGVAPGDRVLVHGDNSPELLLSWFACAWLGAVCVIVNPKSAREELEFYAAHTAAVGIVTQTDLEGVNSSLSQGLNWRIAFDPNAAASYSGLRSNPVPKVDLEPSSAACMMFTSGTSSRPKAVVWSHANVLWAAQAGRAGAGLEGSDIVLNFLPLYHVVGLAWTVLPALSAGASVILQPRFSASRFWNVAIARKATFASHVQFSSAVLSRQPVPPGHCFRLWGNSTWLPEYEQHFGIPIVGWWGMTELIAPGISGRHGTPQQPGTIGFCADGYQLRLADGDKDDLTETKKGELELFGERGRTIFLEYYNDPTATSEAFTADGWFKTGDRMKMHADGSFQFIERSRDVIKCGGESVSPAEVERVIRDIAGVANASVVGRQDEILGEVVVAFVVLAAPSSNSTSQARIIDICKSRLAPFKVPREIRFLAELPVVGINKIAKGELRRQAALSPPVDPNFHV